MLSAPVMAAQGGNAPPTRGVIEFMHFLCDTSTTEGELCDFSVLCANKELDAVAGECLALREQAAIYAEKLDDMEARHGAVRERETTWSLRGRKRDRLNPLRM